MMHTEMPPQRGVASRPGHYWGRSLTELQRATTAGADLDRLDTSIATFFELAAALKLTAPEQRALLHGRAAELRAMRTQPVAGLGLDLAKLQRRLDYAISLMRQMATPLPS